jgi:branched-chain amino acid transport system ATP-binding protein
VSLLELSGVRTGYEGIPVVFGIDLSVDEGEVVALLGANGAGKTSTLRAISGMIPVLGGDIVFDGASIAGRPAEDIARRGLVHVPEGRGIFPSLNVEETLRLAGAFGKVPKAELTDRLDETYATFPRLAERRMQQAGTLSGGEQQMLALARGLIWLPKLLMIDEMSQGLAPRIVADLFELVEEFPKRGVSVLLVEQFVGRALEVANRAYVLEKGEISFAGPAAKLAKDEDFVKGSYLGDVDVERLPDSQRRRRSALPAAEEIPVQLPPALMRGLIERAEREGVSAQELIKHAVADELAPPKRKRTASTRKTSTKKATAKKSTANKRSANTRKKAPTQTGRRRG